jgi:hypothetical protein
MPLQRRNRQSRRMTYTDKRKSHTTVEDQPVSMRDLYESIFNSEGLRGRHDRADLCEVNSYRRRRPITKIFRNSRYMPSLDDIEETDEISDENGNHVHARTSSPIMSLRSLHKERIRNTKGKGRRARSRKLSTRSNVVCMETES